MKRKTKLSLFLIIMLSLLCIVFSGCKKNFTYPLMYGTSQIMEIKIGVKKQESIPSVDIEERYTIKAEINDKDEFIEDFIKLQFNDNFPGDLISVQPDSYAIIIIYDNGDSEEVNWGAQRKNKGGVEISGKVHCDKD
nr:hypothetical protein [Clostridia bacterium]